jgi:parvulin-like peptidyl-prolyl isomerase
VRAAVLTAFLEERVLVIEARARGLLAPGADDVTEQAATRKLLDDEVLSKTRIDDAKVEAHYQSHIDEFRVPERRTLRQVLLATESEARDTRRRLERDPKELELLARSRSRGPEAAKGGLMGTFGPGELPADLERAAFALSPGSISPVVVTALGFHVLRLDALEPARQRSLEESRGAIRARLLRRAADENVRLFVRGLLARAEVNHDAANAANPTGR